MKMKMRMKRIMGLLLALFMTMGCMSLNPIISYANDTDTNTKTFNINDGSVNITKSGNYTINGTGQATPNTISVTVSGIAAKITLNNVNIDVSNQSYNAAFCAKSYGQSNVHLTIILQGTNSLKSGEERAGLMWNNSDNSSMLEIEGDGSLTATGGKNAAGIGSNWSRNGGTRNITITGGTVIATGGYGAAGIGGDRGNSAENIKIAGGTVTATGGDGAAGIGGGGSGSGENITITGGTVTATGGGGAAGIGGGRQGGSGKNITITGGTVTATGVGWKSGAGIGGGGSGSGENITITGGTVTATGGDGAAGIGGGDRGSGKGLTIAGGTVTATGGEDGIGGGAWGATQHIKITGGSVKANSISTTPTDDNGHNVYLVKLENQDSVNEVTVDSGTDNKKTFKRAGNHPGSDTAFYLYLAGQDHDLVTSKGKYKAEWNNTTNAFTVKAKYKVTYKDGANGKYFANHVIPDILSGTTTPTYTPTATRQGYVFAGWTPDPAGTTVTANAVYTATWKEDKNGDGIPDDQQEHFTVTYKDGVNGQVFADHVIRDILTGTDTPTYTPTETRDGYVFAGWTPDPAGTTVTANAVYTATWKEDKNHDGTPDDQQEHFTVTYKDGVNGKAFADQVKSIVTGADTPKFDGTPTRDGYVFDKWTPDVASKVTADATYTATWKEDKNHDGTPDDQQEHFTVTYKDGVNGQAFADQKTSDIVTGADTPKFNGTPSREGYVFAGWSPKVANKVTANATYVAQWKKDHFTVTFKDGDNTQTVKVENGKAIDTDALTGESMPKNPTKTGYTFKEWNTKEDGKGEKFTGESVVNSDMTVYAIYTQSKSPASKPQPKLPSPKSQSGTLDPKTQPETKPAPKPKPAPTPKSIPKTPESKTPAPKPDPKPAHKPQPETKHDPKSIPKTQHEPKPAPKLKPKQKFKAPAPKSKTKQQPKTQSETTAPKSQPEKRIGMIPKKGESALFAGLIAVLGFSIAGLAFFVRRK